MAAAIIIDPIPIAIAYTPNSILENPPPGEIRYAGNRPRYSTCTGTSWFSDNNYLATVNLITSSIQIYHFDETSHSLIFHQAFDNSHGLNLYRPENLSFSKNCRLLAIPNMGSGNINIYEVDSTTFITNCPERPSHIIRDKKVHGAQFSHDGNYLVYVSLEDKGGIYVYKITRDNEGKLRLILSQKMDNYFYPMKPKSIDFTCNDQYVVIAYSEQLSNRVGTSNAVLASYQFDSNKGKINPIQLSLIKNLLSTETVIFYPDSSVIFAVDQVEDKITAHDFDIKTGKLGRSWIVLKNPESQLNLPHGLGISSDGRYLAVSHYGDDKVSVYIIKKE